MKRRDLILVCWEDIVDFAGEDWNDDPTAYPTAGISTLGWVVFPFNKKSRVVHIARDWDEDNNTPRSVIAIPAGCVTSVVDVSLGTELWDRSKGADR